MLKFKFFALLIITFLLQEEIVSSFAQFRNATFSNDSAKSWNPFVYDPSCPRFLVSEVGWAGLGDELEHYIYSLNVAQLLEATIVLQGGLVDGSNVHHMGSSQYPEVAKMLGVPNSPQRNNITALTAATEGEEMTRFNFVRISFPDAMNIRKTAMNSSGGGGEMSSLACYSVISSPIDSCHGGKWCTWIAGPGHHFVTNVRPFLTRNNTARNNCINQQLGFDVCHSSSAAASSPDVALNVVWHIRTGDVKLHAEPTYFHTVMKHLQLALAPTSSSSESSAGNVTSPNYRLQLVFESQERIEFLENMFPNATFNIGRNISDTVCTFLTSDIFISSGSSISLVLAFAGNRKPVIFEELRKEHFMASYKHAVLSMSKKHQFSRREAVLLDHGKPLQDMREVRQIVAAGLADLRADCPPSSSSSPVITGTR